MNGGYPTATELIRALRELRDAMEQGQFTFKPGSRGFQEAHRALQQANETLAKVRNLTPNDGKVGGG
jgi:hypothetical protein